MPIFLTAFVACGLLGVEAFPLTGWRLFSHLRTDHAVSWEAVTVDDVRKERVAAYSRLQGGFRTFVLVARGLDHLKREDQDAVCRTWLASLGAGEVRVYRLDQPLIPREGDRPAMPPARIWIASCGPDGFTSGRESG